MLPGTILTPILSMLPSQLITKSPNHQTYKFVRIIAKYP